MPSGEMFRDVCPEGADLRSGAGLILQGGQERLDSKVKPLQNSPHVQRYAEQPDSRVE